MNIADRIGVSSFWMPGISLEEGINTALEKGFKTFEVVPADFQGVVGYPYTKPSPPLWLRTLSKERKRDLIAMLNNFKIVTVHGPHLGVNIASVNRGIREESVRQYMECIEFAHEAGAPIATFHCGIESWGFKLDPEQRIKWDMEFILKALEYAEKYDLMLGYEVTYPLPWIYRIVTEVNSKRFGVLLDLGHASLQLKKDPEWIPRLKGKIVEVHAHDVLYTWGGKSGDGGGDHQPIGRGNVLDFPKVIKDLKDIGFEGPIVFEIMAKDAPTYFTYCIEGKEKIIKYWNQD